MTSFQPAHQDKPSQLSPIRAADRNARSDAEQYGRRLHTAGYHYRVNEYDERID